MADVDDKFYDRADEYIHLANKQCADIGRGKVSASLMYAVARFNAWVSSCGFTNSEDMKNEKEKTIEYFVTQYRAMLDENLDDYIKNFQKYMQVTDKET